jgi:hypothetical protein
MGDVDLAGGIDVHYGTEPERARRRGPQLTLVPLLVEVASVALASPGPVTGPSQLDGHDAVHLDAPARQRPRDRYRVIEPGAVQHRTWAVPRNTLHCEHRSPAEPLRLGHGLRMAEAVHEGFLDLVFRQQRQAHLSG